MVFWLVLIGVVVLGLALTWRFDRRRTGSPHDIEATIAKTQSRGASYSPPTGPAGPGIGGF
jgi:hypothetical protein